MPIAKKFKNAGGIVAYWCPACKHAHWVPINRWTWNGSLVAPTLAPSVRHYITHEDKREETLCHYYVKDGKIEYCTDCPHELKGQTIDMVPIPDDYAFTGFEEE